LQKKKNYGTTTTGFIGKYSFDDSPIYLILIFVDYFYFALLPLDFWLLIVDSGILHTTSYSMVTCYGS
jgi:hypothetical protein